MMDWKRAWRLDAKRAVQRDAKLETPRGIF
jgi:hypothetical protein